MWPYSINKIEQASEIPSDDLAAPAIPETGEQPAPALPETGEQAGAEPEDESPSAPEKQWNSTTEEEWNEHRETAWALAYVIHRIRSTPNPPILLPAQKQHFQKTIERAAALMEEWQRRERDLAQQLVQAKPVTELSSETAEAIQNDLPDDIPDEVWDKQLVTPSSYLILDDAEEDVQPTQEAPQAPETPAPLYDYEI